MRWFLLLLVCSTACRSGDDPPRSSDTASDTPRRAAPSTDVAPLARLRVTPLAGWSGTYLADRRLQLFSSPLADGRAAELTISELPTRFPRELEPFLEQVAQGDTLDRFASVRHTETTADGFIIEGMREYGLFEHGLAYVRSIDGSIWIYCEGTFPSEALRRDARALCRSASVAATEAAAVVPAGRGGFGRSGP